MPRLLLLLALLLVSPVFAQSTDPRLATETTTYTVKPGDTLGRIARSFSLTAADLAAMNGLPDPNLIKVGQVLRVPRTHGWDDPPPAPFTALDLVPRTATQGRVQLLRLTLEPGAELVGIEFLGRSLPFAATGGAVEALLPTPVLQTPGDHGLLLRSSRRGAEAAVLLPVTVVDGGYEWENLTLAPGTSSLLDPAIVNREHALLEQTCAEFEGDRHWGGAFRHPVEQPQFTSAFGTLRSYNGAPPSGFHRGLDYRGAVGTPVHAAADGRVLLSEDLELYGGTVILGHGRGVCTAYMHLSERLVEAGEKVATGTRVGLVGATGLVTGPHLHWEVRVAGVPVAPLQWVDGDPAASER